MNKAFLMGIIPSLLFSSWIHHFILDQQVPFPNSKFAKDPQIELKEGELAFGPIPRDIPPVAPKPPQTTTAKPEPKAKQQALISPQANQPSVAIAPTEATPQAVNNETQAEEPPSQVPNPKDTSPTQTDSPPIAPQESKEATAESPTQKDIEESFQSDIEENIKDVTEPIPDQEMKSAPAKNDLIQDFETDFPHFENASTGCFGSSECREVNNVGSFRSIGKTLIQQLKDQGITVKFRDDLEDTGREIYELIKPNDDTYFLHIFSIDLGKAAYFIAQDIRDLQDIRDASPDQESTL